MVFEMIRKVRLVIPFLLLATQLAGSVAKGQISHPGNFWEEFDHEFAPAFHAYRAGQDVSLAMEGPAEILRGGYGEWAFTFTAGPGGLAAGQAVAIATRHVSGWGTPQDLDYGAPNYVTASSSADVALKLLPEESFSISNKFFLDYFPWQHITMVEITRGHLGPGESIRLVFGDRSHGSPGFRVPSVAREHALFLGLERRENGGLFIPIPSHLSVRVLAGPAAGLHVIVPTDPTPGTPFRVILRAQDDQGNVAAGYLGTVTLAVQGGTSDLPAAYTFKNADRGLHVITGVRFRAAGEYRIEAYDAAAGLRGESNPSRCGNAAEGLKILWGDFHDHSVVSDGTGSPTDAYLYARDVAGLDFFALTDHDFQMDKTRWELNEDVATRFNDPPHFVTFYGYEWSAVSDVGGDHNVIYDSPDSPLYRSNSYYDTRNPFEYSGPDLDAPHIVQLYKRLKIYTREKNARALVIPHVRGRVANPEWSDPEFTPVIEVASEAGWNEEWALGFLRRGYRLGFMGSSDDHYGRPGYGMADHFWIGYADAPQGAPSSQDRSRVERFDYPWGTDVQGSPLIAVLARDNSRESIMDAIFRRHCYVTSGPRVILDFKSGGHLMGDEFFTDQAPEFESSAQTLDPITAFILKKDGIPLYTFTPGRGSRGAHFVYRDSKDFKGHFYYVEVLTENPQERAASSPLWVD